VRAPVVRDGAVKYVLSAAVRPDSIGRIISAQDFGARWAAAVLDRNNRFVARSREPERVGQPASQSLREALDHAPGGWFEARTVAGVGLYSYYLRSDATGCVV